MIETLERLTHTFGQRDGAAPVGSIIHRQYLHEGVLVESEAPATGSGCGHHAYRCRACGLTICERMVAQHPAHCEGAR